LDGKIKMHIQSKEGSAEEPILEPVHPVPGPVAIADLGCDSKKTV
jgi:hypothetical protein